MSEHRWALSWPGNYCIACGEEDPMEAGLCCPDCHWFGGEMGLDNWEPCVRHKPTTCPKLSGTGDYTVSDDVKEQLVEREET